MFNNFVTFDDFILLAEKVRSGHLRRTVSRIFSSKRKRTEKAWTKTTTPPTNWWDIPAVRERWNVLISGDRQVQYNDYICQKYFADREGLHGLSLGCGTGVREQRWAELGKFRRIDAYDLSEERISYARQKAAENELDPILSFTVGDVYGISAPENSYDVVIAEDSLHHFSPLKDLLVRINGFLKPDGYFVFNEFVGPTHFQWTDRQLEAINGMLSILPARYRMRWDRSSLKSRVVRPSRLCVHFGDPSEAVESARILPLAREIFHVVEVKAYGGTILHMLFHSIGHHFLSEDRETRRFLRLCFEVEDALLESGDLESDFVVAVCRKKEASARRDRP